MGISLQNATEDQYGFDLHPLRGEFRNSKLENDFQRHHLAQNQSQLRITLAFSCFFYLAFAVTDVAVLGYSHEALILFLARLVVAATAIAIIYLVYRRPLFLVATGFAATAVEIVGMTAFMLVVLYRPDEIPWHAMSISIMLIVVYLYIPNRLILALGVALATTVAFLFIVLAAGNLKPSDLITMSMLLLLTNAFGYVAARRYHRLWRDEFQAQSFLKDLSIRDHLTGCYNRRYLFGRLEEEILRAQRHGLWLTVIICDLDHFKLVNDTYGHMAGDLVLRAFSRLLQDMTREHVDCLVRYGGEEFILVLPETDLSGGARLAERLRTAFAENPTRIANNQEIRATASFGVVAVNYSVARKKITPDALIAAADERLYCAKNAGRNHVKSGDVGSSSSGY